MDVVLIILGLSGLGAVAVSTYVFTVAARTYVSDDHENRRGNADKRHPRERVARNPGDRRSGRPVTFPLTVNSILIANDRRTRPDRRATG
ncbi:Uncharacterised protein [Halioglobus japonicus]|nr:Uncharacterised protein [Halioglobus japonicus]